jgi:hypothetical protein
MRMSLLDWIGRLLSLVLAGMLTLSIIGAIAAIPSGSLGTRFGFEQPTRPFESGQPPEQVEPETLESVDQGVATALPGEGGDGAVAPSAARPAVADQWLEVIAYALLALTALGALAVLMLWRMVGELRRIRQSDG